MEIHINKELQPELQSVVNTLKFKSIEEFINKAIRDKIIEIKKERFFEITDKVADRLESRNLSEDDILKDFETKRE